MDGERRVTLTLSVKNADGKVLAAQPIEELRAALTLLGKALGTPQSFSLSDVLCCAPEAIPPETGVYAGLALIITSMGKLTKETRTELAKFAVQELKRILPVTLNWNLYDETRQWTGSVSQHVSQAYAEEKFGLERWPSP
jgi:hypothetical protein